jgi:hypothetical protein
MLMQMVLIVTTVLQRDEEVPTRILYSEQGHLTPGTHIHCIYVVGMERSPVTELSVTNTNCCYPLAV